MRRGLLGLLLAVAATAAAASPGSGRLDDWRAIEDSLRGVQPKFRERWLRERGLDDRFCSVGSTDPESVGLTLVGKWGRGPSVEVTGRDTLVVLTLGSEVALLSFADPDDPRVLSEIQFSSGTGQSQLVGSRLYVSSGRTFEAWDVSDAASPTRLGSLPYGIGDFQVNDTLLYFLRLDTFRVFSVADPGSMRQLGVCRDSGYFLAATESTVVLGHSRRGLYLIDVTDPGNPYRVGTYPSDLPRSASARGSLCCVTLESGSEPYPIRFVTLDISDPANPHQLGLLNDAGGYDLFLDGQLAFASGRSGSREPFQVLSIADSMNPSSIGQCRTTTRYNWGVWANPAAGLAYVADERDGLAVVDIVNPSNPQLDTFVVVAASAEDVCIDGNICYVADGQAGLKLLDVSDPTFPNQVSEVDTNYEGSTSYSVVARDSFAFVSYYYPWFRSVDVSDPANPRIVGGCFPPGEEPKDMALRDSLVYVVMDDDRFQVISVTRPREPGVIGGIRLPERSMELVLADSLAYVANFYSAIVVNVAQPTLPDTVGSWVGRVNGVHLMDTVLFVVAPETLWSINVADPRTPVTISFVAVERYMYDVLVVDTVAYCVGSVVQAVNVADPADMRVIGGAWSPAGGVRRAVREPPFLYLCCMDGGISILDTQQVSVAETSPSRPQGAALRITPTVTRGKVNLGFLGECRVSRVEVTDVMGRMVSASDVRPKGAVRSAMELDLSGMSAGVYLIRVLAAGGTVTGRVVKTQGR